MGKGVSKREEKGHQEGQGLKTWACSSNDKTESEGVCQRDISANQRWTAQLWGPGPGSSLPGCVRYYRRWELLRCLSQDRCGGRAGARD